jgi:hypothetical protein
MQLLPIAAAVLVIALSVIWERRRRRATLTAAIYRRLGVTT